MFDFSIPDAHEIADSLFEVTSIVLQSEEGALTDDESVQALTLAFDDLTIDDLQALVVASAGLSVMLLSEYCQEHGLSAGEALEQLALRNATERGRLE